MAAVRVLFAATGVVCLLLASFAPARSVRLEWLGLAFLAGAYFLPLAQTV